MRKFKHKITGNIATETLTEKNYKVSEPKNFTIPKWIVENSNEWEEILDLPIGTRIIQIRNTESIKETSYEKTKEGWYFGDLKVWIDESDIGEGKRFQIVKEKPVLFFTEDGKEIREGDEYYYVLESINNCIIGKNNCTKFGISLNRKGIKYFSVKEAAEEYIILNKPVLSINDVQKCLNETEVDLDSEHELNYQLKQFVKSKL